jgi:two-component system, cell cycle response regulator DivK
MVVEDNELNLKLFCDLLRAHSHEVAPVKDAREALACAATWISKCPIFQGWN